MKKRIIIGGKDRDYYRSLDTHVLKEEIHYGVDVDWQELAIALAERMSKVRAEVMDECAIHYCPNCDKEL
jgi:hypothetical protein